MRVTIPWVGVPYAYCCWRDVALNFPVLGLTFRNVTVELDADEAGWTSQINNDTWKSTSAAKWTRFGGNTEDHTDALQEF